jgi:hypothetical protein
VASHIDPASVQFLSTTHFGLHLFKLAPAVETKPRIRNFIKALVMDKTDYLNVITQFNVLSEKTQNFECDEIPVDDEVIEMRNTELGIPIEMTDEEAELYSIYYDMTPMRMEQLLKEACMGIEVI